MRTWTVEDGFPEPALDVAQTPDGYLWITTNEGLVRFDGHRFVVHTQETTPVFRSHNHVGLHVTRSGDLWVGGRDAWVYRLRDGVWTPFNVFHVVGTESWVQDFAEDAEGTLWLHSTGRLVGRFDGTTWTRHPQPLRDVWNHFLADADGTLWTHLDAADAPGRPESLISDRGGVVARWDGTRFVPAEGARLLGFASSQHGPLFHRPEGGAAALAQNRRVRVDITDSAGTVLGWYWHEGTPLVALLVDRSGRVWLTQSQGTRATLLVVRDGRVLHRFEPKGVAYIRKIFQDAQGTIWIQSDSSGLIQITEVPFRAYDLDEGGPQFAAHAAAAPDGAVLVSSQAPRGTHLATVRDGVLSTASFALDARTAAAFLKFEDGYHVVDGVARVGHITVDPSGQRWGLLGSYVLRLDQSQALPVWRAERPADFTKERLPELWTLVPDPADASVLWVGDRIGQVFRFDTRTETATLAVQIAPSAEEEQVYVLHPGRDGQLWIGSEYGLTVLDQAGTPTRLASVHVRAFVDGPDGALWAATAGSGLVRLRDGAIDTVRATDGLPSDFLTTLLLDEVGALWASGRQSFYRFRLSQADSVLDGTAPRLDAVTLRPSAGHLSANQRTSQALRAPDGSLWIPSPRGVTRIDPQRYATLHDTDPPVYIEALHTESGDRFALSDDLQLPLGERTLTVDYTAVDLRAPDLVRFRTRLDGRDEAWVDQGARRSVTYGGLRPGRYTLHVQVRNAAGRWSTAATAAPFVVPPRFTETGWFIALCVLGALCLVLVGAQFRSRQARVREATLNALVRSRTEDLEREKQTVAVQADALQALDRAKSNFFANISHEFRTPLTLIIGPLEDVKEGLHGHVSEPVARQTEVALSNGRRLLGLVNQLLDVARLESGEERLSAQPLGARGVVEQAVLPFVPLAERRAIALEVDLDVPSDLTLWADPDQVGKVVGNLLGNALKFTPKGGAVRVTLEVAPPETDGQDPGSPPEGTLVLRVQDSGVGIAAEHLPYVFERFYQADGSSTRHHAGTGIGLALVKHLVELHGGTVEVASALDSGTTFTVRLPLGRAHLTDRDLHPNAPARGDGASGDGASGDGTRPDDATPRSIDVAVLNEVPVLDAAVLNASVLNAAALGDTLLNDDALLNEDDENGDGYAASGAEPTQAEAEAKSVLVVDDNPEVRRYVRRHLARRFRVVEAADGQQALDRARALVPDLIVSDVMMPHLDGIGLCRALRADPDLAFIPLVLLTAKAEVQDKLDGLQHGADDYLTKPFNVHELEVRVENLIASRQRLRDHYAAEAPPTEPLSLRAFVSEEALTPEATALLNEVRTAIEAHLSEDDFGVDALAEAVGLGRSSLYRRLSGVLTVSPMELIWHLRLERAAALLRTERGTVSEVAYATGFKNVGHFCTRFKEAFGRTPAAYAAEGALEDQT